MAQVARNGDTIEHEDGTTGTIIATCQTVFVNNLAVARMGDTCSEHGGSIVSNVALTVYAENIQVALLGSITDCESVGTVISASPNVFAT